MFEKKYMGMLYEKAEKPSDLPWHVEECPPFLAEAVESRPKRGKALDLGCGAGLFSIYLAKSGYEVTSLDFIPKALEMAKKNAAAEGVKINWVMNDILSWTTDKKFDIVLDSGCFHNISQSKMYKQKILEWLSYEGDLVLGHFGKRHLFDWRPVGPIRRSRKKLNDLFSPELKEVKYSSEIAKGIALPIGPTVLLQQLWFKRASASIK